MDPVRWVSSAIALSVATSAGAALAQGAGLQTRTQDGVSYVAGGVGTAEQEAMKDLGQEGYDLQLVFAERGTGAYLADVHVVVSDSSGRTVLDAMADGPALFAKLPRGRYHVVAEHGGVRQERTVSTGRGPLALYFPSRPGSAPEPADSRATHGEAPSLAGGHAGEPAYPMRGPTASQ